MGNKERGEVRQVLSKKKPEDRLQTLREKVKGYNFPQGVLGHLVRATASGKPGIVTPIGLNTYVDPRLEGGRLNDITTEDLVEVLTLDGKEYLFYKSIPIDVAFIRGTTADCEGNLTMEEEVGTFSMLSLAQAAKVNNGIVIAQVKRTIDGHSDPTQVKVPGVFIDYVVVEPNQEMTFLTAFDPALVKRDVEYEAEELRLELYEKINALGIGAQGLGGLTTVLDVKVKDFPTHAANKAVAIIPNCAATRHVHFTLDGSGNGSKAAGSNAFVHRPQKTEILQHRCR